jgi:hypothetical protein
MALLTQFPQHYKKPEPLNKSFDMIVRDWSRQQFGGDEVVDEIRKALGTGINTYGAITTGGSFPAGEASALRLENLDNTMTSVLATAEHLKIFRFLHKEPSKQPFYQWNRRESYGSTRGFFGFREGGLPNGGKGQWSRNGAYIKFLGTKGGVTHPVVLTNILGGMSMDPVAEDQLGRTMDFMQRVERAIMYGDDDIKDGDGTESNYDGILKQLTTQRTKSIIDLQGRPLTLDAIANAATRLVTEGKLLSFNDVTLFMSPRNIEDLGKLRYSTIYSQGRDAQGALSGINSIDGPGTRVDRADLTTSARTDLIAGLSVVGQATSFGVIPFEWSIFTEPVEGGLPLDVAGGAADPGSPSAPTVIDALSSVAMGSTIPGLLVSGSADVSSASLVAGTTYIVTAFGGSATFPGLVGTADATAVGKVFVATGAGVTGGTVKPVLDANIYQGSVAVSYANTSNFSTYSGTDKYWYGVSAVNDSGESLMTVSSTGVTVTGSDKQVRVQYARSASTGTSAARVYRIYRITKKTGITPSATDPDWRYVGYDIDGKASSTTTRQIWIDRNGTSELYNNSMPDTNLAPLLCRNPADLVVAQMSPLLKMPLAPVSTTFEYLLLLYHTLVVKAPERQIIFKNVGLLT